MFSSLQEAAWARDLAVFTKRGWDTTGLTGYNFPQRLKQWEAEERIKAPPKIPSRSSSSSAAAAASVKSDEDDEDVEAGHGDDVASDDNGGTIEGAGGSSSSSAGGSQYVGVRIWHRVKAVRYEVS